MIHESALQLSIYFMRDVSTFILKITVSNKRTLRNGLINERSNGKHARYTNYTRDSLITTRYEFSSSEKAICER